MLGEITAAYTPTSHIAEVSFWLLAPFAYAVEVTESWLIFDGYLAAGIFTPTFESERVVYAARLRDGATFYVVPYTVSDRGALTFGEPSETAWMVPSLFEALGKILDRRAEMTTSVSYAEACAALVKWL